jgi:hypothetical protein
MSDEIARDILEGAKVGYDRGEHEALEDALDVVLRAGIAPPPWLVEALKKRLRERETPREKQARQTRGSKRERATLTIAISAMRGSSFENAGAEAAALLGVDEPTIKKALDWFRKNYKSKTVRLFGPEVPAPKRSSRIR